MADMGSQGTTVVAYAPKISGYADAYFLRQVANVGASLVLAHGPCPSLQDANILPNCTNLDVRSYRTVGRKIALRAGLAVGLDPLASRRLSRAVGPSSVLYTMFLTNAIDVYRLVGSESARSLVVHAAGTDVTAFRSMPYGYQRAIRRLLQRVSLTLCGSRFLLDRFKREFPYAPAVLHYIGVPVVPQLSDELRLASARNGELRALVVSRLHPVKGVMYSLRAFALVAREYAGATLDVAGDGPERAELERAARNLGIGNKVRFHGQIDPPAVQKLMKDAHVLLQHNVPLANGAEEALGGSLLEAAATGLPAVATRSGGVAEAVLDGTTGFLVRPTDVEGMARALRRLFQSDRLRVEMGAAGHRFVAEVHNAGVQDSTLRGILNNEPHG